MNLTVGPHPPAVYWRRRAIVGAPLLVILVLFASCLARGSEGATNKPKAEPKPTLSAQSTVAGPQTSHECTRANPCEPAVEPSSTASATPPPLLGTVVEQPTIDPTPTKAAPQPCSDSDVSLRAVIEKSTYPSGVMPRFKLLITNVSKKACVRDVGASHQELRVMAGEGRVWSSDDCSPNHGSDARVLDPGEKRTYWLTWSGKGSAPGCPKPRQRVEPGEYQLLGRLGMLLSKPVPFTITG